MNTENIEHKLIINTEYFLQCYGSCSGCFLSEDERKSENIFHQEVKMGLERLQLEQTEVISHLVIGFGRGNLLNLDYSELDDLVQLIRWCEENFNYHKITFEISTSLIGKLDTQIEKAYYLLNESQNIFFNIVVNSEITSPSFWNNLKTFYNSTAVVREGWGWVEDFGDILVLNINPQKLPDLEFIENFTQHYHSPINISIFPYEANQKTILKQDIEKVNLWAENLWHRLHHKDLNIKNYLEGLYSSDFDLTPQDLHTYHKVTEGSYFFIDKTGLVTKGMPSIMGEVDFPRLLEKYQVEPDLFGAYKVMQKNAVCSGCNYQKECLVSGAFLNLLSNGARLTGGEHCASGYKNLFKLASQKYT